MSILKYWYKYTDIEKYREIKEQTRFEKRKKKFDSNFKLKLDEINYRITNKNIINFKHSGHIGDVIYALPVIKELSKTHTCNLYIHVNKFVDRYAYKHSAGKVYINSKIFEMFKPLMTKIDYINQFDEFSNQEIDVDLDLFRELPFELKFTSFRWFIHLTGIFPNYKDSFLNVEPHNLIKDKVVIVRSFRARNSFVDYSFLSNYNNLLFIGLKSEYEDLKISVPNLEYYDTKDFYEMAQIIKASKFFLGNQSFAYSLAEALKVPRLLEAYADFPVVNPEGENGYDFYFQIHFEQLFNKLYNS